MKLIKIQANPADWDLSTLRAESVERNGRMLSPVITEMIAEKLPGPHLSVWRAAVAEFRALGKGEWNAASVKVYKVTQNDETYLICDIYAYFPDGTTDSLSLNLPSPEMIAFFNYFTDESSWPNPQSTMQP